MGKLTVLLFVLSFLSGEVVFSQLERIRPDRIYPLDFGPEAQKKWEKLDSLYEFGSWDDYTEDELDFMRSMRGESMEDMWDVLGFGCSFYCGAGAYKTSVSSSLDSNHGFSYGAKELSDFSYQTAWVEGVPGPGLGEKILFDFEPQHPRLNSIIVVNGYVKDRDLWEKNNRVRELLIRWDGKPLGILELEDTASEQFFPVPLIGYSDRQNYEALKQKPGYSLEFEILSIYPGSKYDDTVITEIYFDGIDVH